MRRLAIVMSALGVLLLIRPTGRPFTPAASAQAATAAAPAGSSSPTIEGCPVFPPDNPWNRDISGDPVDPNSARYIAYINSGGDEYLHADFGSNLDYGIPYNVVPGSQPKVPIDFVEYGDESDVGIALAVLPFVASFGAQHFLRRWAFNQSNNRPLKHLSSYENSLVKIRLFRNLCRISKCQAEKPIMSG